MRNVFKICASLLIFFNVNVFSQDFNFSEIDTLISDKTIPTEYKLKLNSDFKVISSILSNKYFWDEVNSYDFYIPEFHESSISEMKSNLKLREDISKALLIYRQGLNKNDLGVLGQILGYTNAAAAIGLAAYHVYKYRDKYGIKK